MRNVDTQLLEDKMDEAVTHYINSHSSGEGVAVDASSLALNVHSDGGGRVVTVMNHQSFSQVCRQLDEGGPWGEELMDPESRLAAIVAHLSQHPRSIHKIPVVRSEVDSTVILDTPLRLFNGHSLEQHTESIAVEVPTLPPLPSLQDMKRCPDGDWFNKTKNSHKPEQPIIQETEGQVIEVAGGSPAQNKQNKKSLPHKKRISKKLKRNPGGSTPQQDLVVISNCNEDVPQEEILPDNFVQHHQTLQHIAHEVSQVRPIFICQLCGDFYGEEQLKFYHHLKQHYEPHSTIIIENPVPDLGIDKMTNTCIVDSSATLPDSIVELSLENTVPKTMYQTIDKNILYTSSEKTLYPSSKVHYSLASMEKEPNTETEKSDLYETLDKMELFACTKCNKTFRKQKACEAHFKEVHSSKLEDMAEFSEPEDLMAGIHVSVEEPTEQYEQTILPHLTVDNGHVTQEHSRHWYNTRSTTNNSLPCGTDGAYCPVCPTREQAHSPPQLKEEVLQRIFDTDVHEVQTEDNQFSETVIENNIQPHSNTETTETTSEPDKNISKDIKTERKKEYTCLECGRVFRHRNSLSYHMLVHEGRQQNCNECGKSFLTVAALKIHKRVHSGDRPYKCEHCDKEFKQGSDLMYHKISIHSNQKRHKCDFCGKEFARKYSLSLHRRIHTGERNFKCDYCSKTFRASSYKTTHMRSHTGIKPYKCQTCDKCFRIASDLRRHSRTHQKPTSIVETKIKHEVQAIDQSDTQPNDNIEHETEKASTNVKHTPRIIERKCKAAKKNQIKKIVAPNVTITNKMSGDMQLKIVEYGSIVNAFDGKSEYNKYKDVYSEATEQNQLKPKEQYSEPILVTYKDVEQRLNEDRELSILRSYKNSSEEYKTRENTDGKMQVYTHMEKQSANGQINLNDMRSFERDVTREVRIDLQGEVIESGFFEKLTTLYNISAV